MKLPPPRHVVVLGAQPEYLTGLRGPMIRDLLARGHRVTAIGSEEMAEVRQSLEEWGAAYEVVPIRRAGLNPLLDIRAFVSLVAKLRRLQADVLFAYTIKPVVYGLPAAAAAGIKRRFAMISGRGYVFLPGQELRRRLARKLSEHLYRFGLNFADGVLFHNEDDRELFLSTRMMSAKARHARIFGSGVDLARFSPAPFQGGPLCFLMISRLLADKGVREYVGAAERLKRDWPEARFLFVGPNDPSPNGISSEELRSWKQRGAVEFVGALADVRPALAEAHVYVLPSYGEGLPRSVLEAMATGRPIITTDAPGCRDTVPEGENGYLVPAADEAALVRAMEKFLVQPDQIDEMGQASLALARGRFNVVAVNESIIGFMGL